MQASTAPEYQRWTSHQLARLEGKVLEVLCGTGDGRGGQGTEKVQRVGGDRAGEGPRHHPGGGGDLLRQQGTPGSLAKT